MKKLFQHIVFVLFFAIITSCGEGQHSGTETSTNTLSENDTDMEETPDNSVIYNIPNPMETLMLIKMSGVKFDNSLLNPTANIANYHTQFAKATNLGIYAADLSFCFLYEENNDINKYIKNVNELTTSIGVDGNFMQLAAERIKANSANLDSVREIVSEVSVNTSLYLRENRMNSAKVAMAAGGWVESAYIVAKLAEKSKNEELIELIVDQKYVLENLIQLMEQFKGNAEISVLLTDIKGIASEYESLKEIEAPVTASHGGDEEIQSIGSSSTYELPEEQLQAIIAKISALRNKLIS